MSSAPAIYYVTPDEGNCTVNGTNLSPCYTLQQLISDDVLDESSVELLFLSGTHLIPENQTLNISHFSEVVVHPLNMDEEVVIQCLLNGNLAFQNVTELDISALHFTFCTLQYGIDVSTNITNCTFESSRKERAIIIRGPVNLQIANCKFLSNYGGIGTEQSVNSGAVTVHITDTLFEGNGRGDVGIIDEGGALYIEDSILTIKNSWFINNTARLEGGVMCLKGSSLTINETEFDNNTSVYESTVLQLISSSVTIDRSNFTDNSGNAINIISSQGSQIQVKNCRFVRNIDAPITVSSADVTIDNCLFRENSGDYGGAININDANWCPISDCIFENNSAHYGGAVFIEAADPRITNSHFTNNWAEFGGVLYISNAFFLITDSSFKSNSALHGGAIYAFKSKQSCTIDHCTFEFNKAEIEGGAIYCKDYIYDTFTIKKGYSVSNSAGSGNGGFAYLSNCNMDVDYDNHSISNNTALNGGAIYARDSTIRTRTAVITMANNVAGGNGGALHLINSYVRLHHQSSITFDSNVAVQGAAIFVQDRDCEEVTFPFQCFLVEDDDFDQSNFFFANNTASQGPVLYGGLLDRCFVDYDEFYGVETLGIDFIKTISEYEPTELAITSDPVRICLCDDSGEHDCTTRSISLKLMRGQSIPLLATAVDQDNNLRDASFIRARYNESSAKLGEGEGIIKTGSNCTRLTYHIFTNNISSATLVLQPEGYCERSDFSSIAVHIIVTSCSRGFEKNEDRCECDSRLTNHSPQATIICNIDDNTITSSGSLWLRYYNQTLKVHANCPLDYCQDEAESTISLADPDEQCANNRSGVICGACHEDYSVALGGSKCFDCTSRYDFAWLIPLFAVAGMALVALLLVCNMTVSHGTINGLIFYANVVSIAGLTSLRNCSIHPILSVFIAWLNLDFGVETCFYSGMNTYQKTMLQFAFPLYIWLLVLAIILLSHYTVTAMKVFGRNSIAVLATLFLLSYAKILKTIITALNFTHVYEGNADNVSDLLVPYKVWTYDGNIEYLSEQHIPLFLVALAFLVFLFVPYILLLTFGQWIRSLPTRRRCVLWCIRSTAFISILDAYHAPYSKEHRYWTGFMLLVRCVLFFAFAFNYTDSDLLANMYITTIVLVGILVLKIFTTKVYKNYCVNILEICFLINLVILSATLYYLRGSSRRDTVLCECTSVSISVSMVFFFGILAYHAYLRLNKTRCFTSIKNTFLAKLPRREQQVPDATAENAPLVQRAPSKTTVDLREELLESSH